MKMFFIVFFILLSLDAHARQGDVDGYLYGILKEVDRGNTLHRNAFMNLNWNWFLKNQTTFLMASC